MWCSNRARSAADGPGSTGEYDPGVRDNICRSSVRRSRSWGCPHVAEHSPDPVQARTASNVLAKVEQALSCVDGGRPGRPFTDSVDTDPNWRGQS